MSLLINHVNSQYQNYNYSFKGKNNNQYQTTYLKESPQEKKSHKLLLSTIGILALAVIGKLIFRKPNLKTPSINLNQNNPQPKMNDIVMEMTDDAKKIYNKFYDVFHSKKKVKIDSEFIDNNLTTKPNKKVWDTQDMKQYYTELETNSNKILNLEAQLAKTKAEFTKSLETSNLKELRQIELAYYEERGEFIKSVDKNSIGFRNIKLTPEQKLQDSYLDEKRKLISEKIEQVKKEFYEKILKRPEDKQINVPTSDKYLNFSELEAFDSYYDNYAYNSVLRAGKNVADVEEIQLMDRAFSKAPATTEDCVVYRGVHGHPVFKKMNEFVDSIKEGVIIKDSAYISTSIDSTNAQFRQFASDALGGNGVILRIKLPKGTKGVLGGYKEFVLPRNSSIKINKLETVEGVKIADAEYILP